MPGQIPLTGLPVLTVMYKKVGDRVKIGEPLFSYESDGAVFEEFSAVEGYVSAEFFKAGDRISGGVPVLAIEKDGPDGKSIA